VSSFSPVTVYDLVRDPLVATIGESSRLVKFAVRSSQLPLLLQAMVKVILSPTAKPTTALLPKPLAETLNPPVFTAPQPADASASRLVPRINATSARSAAKKIAAERIGAAPGVLQHRFIGYPMPRPVRRGSFSFGGTTLLCAAASAFQRIPALLSLANILPLA